MSLDHRLIDLLVCPVCKGPLELVRDEAQRPTEFVCRFDRLAFRLQDGIPLMMSAEARPLSDAQSPPAAP